MKLREILGVKINSHQKEINDNKKLQFVKYQE